MQRYVSPNGTSSTLDTFIRMLSESYGSNPAFKIEIGGFDFRMLDRGSSARGSKGMRVIVGSYLELQRGAVQVAETNCRIAAPVFQVIEKDMGGGGGGAGGRSMSVFQMGAPKPVWQSLHETMCPVEMMPKTDASD